MYFVFPKDYVHSVGNIVHMFYFEYCEKKLECEVLNFVIFMSQ